MTDPEDSPVEPGSEALFASWLERVEAGEEVDLEELCRQHPDKAAGLRSLHGRWRRLQGALDCSSLHGALAGVPVSPLDRGVDPEPSPASVATSPGDLTSEVLARLTAAGPSTIRYAVEGEVAHGGMGAVLRVWDADLRRHLAMKVMLGRSVRSAPADTPSADPRLLARFLEEAQVTGQLDHPGIVPVHDLGLDAEGRVYFTMKLVQGRTLREVLDQLGRGEGDWTQARVLGLLQKVCEAMSYAHAKGVIHRDLKPANVMVGRFGEAYVMDWGLAKVLGGREHRDIRLREESGPAVTSERLDSAEDTPDSPLLTMDGDVVGTPAYMPPEQARGDLAAMGPHSDVYAVGAMLYHLLAGHMPYVAPGERRTSRAVWRLVREGPPRALEEVAPRAPPELVALCKKAMAREPGRRYADMSALSADLQAFLEGRVVAAYEAGAWAEARKWVRRNRPLAGAFAAVVLATVGGAIAFALKAGQAARRSEDVFRLSVLLDAQELLDEAGSVSLWPPQPDRVAALVTWIDEARSAVAWRPEFERMRMELRQLALERSPEEIEQERSTHPDFPDLAEKYAELSARTLALEQRRSGGVAPLPLDRLELEDAPADSRTLNRQAWWRVSPDRSTFGQEALGLALAQRALERVGEDASLRAMVEDTLAWAWFALGRDEQALEASRRALEVAPEEQKQAYRDYHGRLTAKVDAASSREGLRAAKAEVARLEHGIAELEERVRERRHWRFPEEQGQTRWWEAQLTELIAKLDLLQLLLGEDALVPGYGWSVPRRLSFARELEAGSAAGGHLARAWTQALPAIRKAYPGLEIEPQTGLVPIGPDPGSGLWEFAHLMSGVEAHRRADGGLELTEETGIVLVLLPGGPFLMGAQATDPGGDNFDPDAKPSERPVHAVHLSPFFLSKYEMTRGQWLRLTGSDPSFESPLLGEAPLLLPVQGVSWEQGRDWLPRAGLSLPSEAQWEHGARGGTSTVWWTGSVSRSLRHAANLYDQARARWQGAPREEWPELDDGFALQAPVGSFAANSFGLHDVVGNVSELCLDGYSTSFYESSHWSDPVAPWQDCQARVLRGGSFGSHALTARSAYRIDCLPAYVSSGLGIRPARALDP